jgi:hypothetical protein
MGWHSEEMVTLPAWAPGEGSVALLERVHDELPQVRDPLSAPEPNEEEAPCWWILAMLDTCDGKEAREAYYSRL